MAEEFSLSAKISGDTSELKQSLDSGKDALREFGIDLNKITEFLTGGAGLALAFAAVAEKGIEAAKVFDEAGAKLGKMTGETGAALDGLKTSLANVSANGVVQNIDDIGNAMGMLHIRLGLVGDDLEKSTMQFSSFADVTGQTVAGAVTDVTKLMAQWNIPASELAITLDKLTVTSQLTGEQASVLTQTLTQAGPVFKSAGINIDEAAGMLIGFSKAGIDAGTATGAINIALRKFAQEGVKDSGAALTSLIAEIKNTDDKSRATTLAVEGFGRAGITMATAIRSGALDINEWTKKIQEADGALERTDKATESFEDVTAKLGNQLQGLLAESFKSVLEIAKPFLQMLSDGIKTFEALPGPVKQIAESLGLMVGALQIAKVAIAAFGISANLSLGPIIIALTTIVMLASQIPSMLNEASKAVDVEVVKRYGLAWFDASKSLKENEAEFNKLRKTYQEFGIEVKNLEAKKARAGGFLDPDDEGRLQRAKEGVIELKEASVKYVELLKEQAKASGAASKAAEDGSKKTTNNVHVLTDAEKKAAEERLKISAAELDSKIKNSEAEKQYYIKSEMDRGATLQSVLEIYDYYNDQELKDFEESQNKKKQLAINTATKDITDKKILAYSLSQIDFDYNSQELEYSRKMQTERAQLEESYGDQVKKTEQEILDSNIKSAEQSKAEWDKAITGVTTTIASALPQMGAVFSSLDNLSGELFSGIKDGVKDVGKFISNLAGEVASIVNSIFGVIDKATQASSQKEIAAIDKEIAALQKKSAAAQKEADKELKAKNKAIDKETEELKKAAGVATKTTIEKDQAALASAIATGDAIAIKEAQDALTSDTIDAAQAAKKEALDAAAAAADEQRALDEAAAEEALQQKKSDLAYKAAHAQWEMQIIQAAAGAALAIIQCYSSLGPIAGTVAAVLVGATTGIEIGLLASNEPQRASYAQGTSFSVGGAANLAEEGPELVMSPSVHSLAKGSTVLTAAQTAQAMGGNGSTINVNVGQATHGTVGEIARAINSESRKLAFAGII